MNGVEASHFYRPRNKILGDCESPRGAQEGHTSYDTTAEPITIGYLMDFTLPPMFPEEMKADFTRCFDLIFEEATEQGLMDRPVQMIYREV